MWGSFRRWKTRKYFLSINAKFEFSRRRGVLAWNHWSVNDGDIQTEPYFHANNTVVGRDGDSDGEDTYRPENTVFKVKRKRFLGREDDFLSEFLFRRKIRLHDNRL